MTSPESLFTSLHQKGKKIALLDSAQKLLQWDQETGMPSKALLHRSDSLETLAGEIHHLQTSASFRKQLEKLIDFKTGQILAPSLSSQQKGAVKAWRREFQMEVKLPKAFVRKFSKATSLAVSAWTEAKKQKRFALFQNHLQKIVHLCIQKANYLGYQAHPYDALLDIFEPGLTIAKIDPVFNRLRDALSERISRFGKAQKNLPPITGHYPERDQLELSQNLLNALGLKNDIAKLDLSCHPFCTGISPFDTRVTTRVFENNPLSCLLSVLHEAGHALYHNNLPAKFFGTALYQSASHAIDESQSRLWEVLIGHSKPFFDFFYPHFEKQFKKPPITKEALQQQALFVQPSFIRVESDPVTYPLHIQVRYEIERDLIDERLKVKDIPEAWNEKMQKYLGIKPPSDDLGCLQDIHWSIGAFGYFPTYTLGTLYACQFFDTLKVKFPDWQAKVASGDFAAITNWLKENIHQYGREFTPEELCQRVTGKDLSESAYLAHIDSVYLKT